MKTNKHDWLIFQREEIHLFLHWFMWRQKYTRLSIGENNYSLLYKLVHVSLIVTSLFKDLCDTTLFVSDYSPLCLITPLCVWLLPFMSDYSPLCLITPLCVWLLPKSNMYHCTNIERKFVPLFKQKIFLASDPRYYWK